jgi:hypothetical protein
LFEEVCVDILGSGVALLFPKESAEGLFPYDPYIMSCLRIQRILSTVLMKSPSHKSEKKKEEKI